MADGQKELLEKYAGCARERQAVTDCLVFQNSFGLSGARMTLEIVEEYLSI